MPRLTVKALNRRVNRAVTNKDLWRSYLDDAYSLALPNRNLFASTMGDTTARQKGEVKNDQVFDSTLMTSTIKAANRLQSDLTPPFHKWADLTPGPFIPKEQHTQARELLSNIRDALFAAIHLSNFDTAVNEFNLDLMSGMGVMMVIENRNPGEAPFNFLAIPRAQVAVEDGPLGTVAATYRFHRLPARDFEERFGDHFKKPDGWEQYLLDQKDKETEEEIRECVYFDAKEGVHYYDVLWKGSTGTGNASDDDAFTRIVERELKDTPFIVARWMKVAGEAEGRGPILNALPDAKTANKVVEFVLRNAAFAVSGIWLARNDGILNPNSIRIIPGAVIPVGATGGALGASLVNVPFGGDLNVAQIVLEDLRMSIRKAMMDNGLPEETGAVRSATEIIARLRELVQEIGSPFGRLMSEFIRPVLQKTVNILIEQGMIDLKGGELKLNGGHVQVTTTSPLAREQDLNDVENTVRWAQVSAAVAGEQMAPVAVRVEDVHEYMAGKMNVSPTLLRDKTEKQQMQEQIGTMVGQQIAQGGVTPIGVAQAATAAPAQQRLAA